MATLPRPAPEDPLPLAAQWLDEAESTVGKNPWAMALATSTPAGQPSVRFVLLKSLSVAERHLVFYTNYASRKAAELEATGSAACVLYWPDLGRQLRFEGPVARSPADESNAYFASRPRLSQMNAWVSEQSRPIETPDLMPERLRDRERSFSGMEEIPRPTGWGGFRLTIAGIEFWVEGADRFHERLRYEWSSAGRWRTSWLQP